VCVREGVNERVVGVWVRWASHDDGCPPPGVENTRLVHVLAWRFAKLSNIAETAKIFAADYV